jgi:hypothetical protein
VVPEIEVRNKTGIMPVATLRLCAPNSSECASPAGKQQNDNADHGDEPSAVRPLDLAGHEAAGKDVDSLEDPDDAHADEQDGENS